VKNLFFTQSSINRFGASSCTPSLSDSDCATRGLIQVLNCCSGSSPRNKAWHCGQILEARSDCILSHRHFEPCSTKESRAFNSASNDAISYNYAFQTTPLKRKKCSVRGADQKFVTKNLVYTIKTTLSTKINRRFFNKLKLNDLNQQLIK